jgi:phosphohistidine swiveling domain-containing protein
VPYQREFTARSRFHMLEGWLSSYLPPTRETTIGCDLRQIICVGERGEWTAYFDQADVQHAGQIGLSCLSDPAALQHHLLVAEQAGLACLAACEGLAPVQVERFSQAELVARLQAFFAAYIRLQACYQISGTHFMALASARLADALDVPGDQRSELLSTITIGDQRGLKTFQEKLGWLTLLLDAQTTPLSQTQIEERIQQHTREFAYVSVGSDTLGADSLQHFRDRLQQDMQFSPAELRSRLDELNQRHALLHDSREQALARLKLSPQARMLADGLALIGVNRLQLREVFTRATHRSYSLFQQVFRIYQQQVGPLDDDLLRQLSINEVLALASGETLPRRRVQERFEHGLCAVLEGAKLSLRGVPALHESARLLGSFATRAEVPTNQLSGTVGYAGPTVQGRALVIQPGLSQAEQVKVCSQEMRPDDILVAGMTYPSLVPACEMAQAIVTNFGGITCHAVIVAREFNIPCIVGTGNATQLIKTGDLIEVDTKANCVRILSSANS